MIYLNCQTYFDIILYRLIFRHLKTTRSRNILIILWLCIRFVVVWTQILRRTSGSFGGWRSLKEDSSANSKRWLSMVVVCCLSPRRSMAMSSLFPSRHRKRPLTSCANAIFTTSTSLLLILANSVYQSFVTPIGRGAKWTDAKPRAIKLAGSAELRRRKTDRSTERRRPGYYVWLCRKRNSWVDACHTCSIAYIVADDRSPCYKLHEVWIFVFILDGMIYTTQLSRWKWKPTTIDEYIASSILLELIRKILLFRTEDNRSKKSM